MSFLRELLLCMVYGLLGPFWVAYGLYCTIRFLLDYEEGGWLE